VRRENNFSCLRNDRVTYSTILLRKYTFDNSKIFEESTTCIPSFSMIARFFNDNTLFGGGKILMIERLIKYLLEIAKCLKIARSV